MTSRTHRPVLDARSWVPGPGSGYGWSMTEMADHQPHVALPDVPEGEEVSPADAAERVDEKPEEQQNRVDPVWSETAADETGGDQADPGSRDA